MASVTGAPSQCGMKIISNLNAGEDLMYQITMLENQVFGKGDRPCQAMAILTDQVHREKNTWAETKSVAFKSEERLNINSMNMVRVYIVYPEHVKLLRAMLPTMAASIKKVVEKIISPKVSLDDKVVFGKIEAHALADPALVGHAVLALRDAPSGGQVMRGDVGTIRRVTHGLYIVDFKSQNNYWVNVIDLVNSTLYEVYKSKDIPL